jgi:hypothetical protein
MLKPNSPVTANLIKARELIVDPDNWSPNGSVEDGMCAVQAVGEAMGFPPYEEGEAEREFLRVAAREQQTWRQRILGSPPSIIKVNYSGHAATIRMFDRAIELSLQDA